MYEALHQRNIRIGVITGEKNPLYGTNTHTKNNFPTQFILNGAVVF
jgi:hypothetical protein